MASIPGITGAQQAEVTAANIDAALDQTILDVYSDKIFNYALPQLVLLQFSVNQQELQRSKGDTIKFHRFAPIARGGKQREGVPVTAVTLDHSTTQIKVDEYANKVSVTERLNLTSAINPLDRAAKSLADDYAVMTNVEQVKVLRGMPSVIFANEKANRTSLLATDGLSTRTIRAAVENAVTNKVPKINLFRMEGAEMAVPTGGQAYVCLIHPHQARSLREDPDWKAPHQYQDTRHIYYGEIGMYENVIFIETTLMPIVKATTGKVFIDGDDYSIGNDPIAVDGSPETFDTYEAFFIGEYLWGFASALDVEMRDDPPQDLGRIRNVGYYAIQGQGLLNEDHGMVIVTR